MALAFALSGETLFVSSAGGPIGLAVGAVGAVFIFLGFAIASLLKRDPYEQFAENCFISDSWDDEAGGSSYDWAPVGLPLKTAVEQSKLLVMMLAAFSVRRVNGGDPYPSGRMTPNHQSGLPWLFINSGGISKLWDGELDTPHGWIQVDLGHFPVGSRLDIEVVQRYGSDGILDDESDVAKYTTMRSLIHERPGILNLREGSKSEAGLHFPEYIAETEAVRAVRFPLRPASFRSKVSGELIFWEDFSLKMACLSYVVRARVFIAGQPMLYATIPEGSRWVGFDARKDEGVSALSTGAYSS